ncbi:MAG: cobalamin-dependent protein, partial [Hyphomicrobiaceae bacterium]|nr:cobalamin-dependent protein [Hyphomicrobiaceae bacterium]
EIEAQLRSILDNHQFDIDQTAFVASEILHREDAAQRQDRLAQVISEQIVPRLMALNREARCEPILSSPSEAEIIELARLVLSPDLEVAAAYVTLLRERGATTEDLFVELLQPAAQYLGTMWDRDECDFVDVTLGVGRLQKLLAVFNCTHNIPALSKKRRVFLTPTRSEQHSFGLMMVHKLLSAAGWNVTLASEPAVECVSAAVAADWYAVAGITLSCESHIDAATDLIAAVRRHSRNPAIGVMVGGAHLESRPELVAQLGADATACNATTAVILAQKLFDIGAQQNWRGTSP